MQAEITQAEHDSLEPHLRELYRWRGGDSWVLGRAVRTVARDDQRAILKYLDAIAAGAVVIGDPSHP